MALDLEMLRDLNVRLSAPIGVPASELTELLRAAFEGERSAEDVDDYRLGKRPWKKLRDEVSPISAFLNFNSMQGNVRFPLDNNVPDAWFTPADEAPIGIEVTRALGRTDYELSKELVREGVGPGFLGLQDDAPQADFDHQLQCPRAMHSTPQALDTVSTGILRCLGAKNDAKYAGMWLLVLAPLSILPHERWTAIVSALRKKAASMPFDQVHVFDRRGQQAWGFQIK